MVRSTKVRRLAAAVGTVVVMVVAGGCSGQADEPRSSAAKLDEKPSAAPTTAVADVAEVAETEAAPEPVVTYQKVRSEERIPFTSRIQRTADLRRGVRQVGQQGRHGTRVQIVRITLTDGVETGREVVRTFVARKPVARVVLRGTFVPPPPPKPSCDPNYAGACVPIASDVDCGGGSGNGPEYVYGTVEVVGSDIYDLDADGDGYGCD